MTADTSGERGKTGPDKTQCYSVAATPHTDGAHFSLTERPELKSCFNNSNYIQTRFCLRLSWKGKKQFPSYFRPFFRLTFAVPEEFYEPHSPTVGVVLRRLEGVFVVFYMATVVNKQNALWEKQPPRSF